MVKFDLLLIYILKVYRKKSSLILLRKNMLNSFLPEFSFEKHVLSQVLKDFSVENLETTACTFLSKNFYEICLSQFIYHCNVTLYLVRGAISLVCVLSVFLPFFILFFFIFFFFLVFSLIDTNNLWDSREGKRNHYFSCFQLTLANEHSFSSSRFLPLPFTDLFVIIRPIDDETCSP